MVGESFCVFAVMSAAGEVEKVGEALQRVVDAVCESVGHVGGRGGSGVLHQSLLLALLAHAHGGKVGEDLHHADVVVVERLGPSVSHDPDGAASLFDLPGEEDAVGDGGGINAHDVEKALGHIEELGPSPLEANAAGAGMAGEGGVQEGRVLACGCGPVVVVLVGLVLLFDADAGAVGTAEVNGGVDEFLKDGVGLIDEGAGEAVHAFDLRWYVAGM